jgi:hypothetical protein
MVRNRGIKWKLMFLYVTLDDDLHFDIYLFKALKRFFLKENICYAIMTYILPLVWTKAYFCTRNLNRSQN